MKKLIFLLTMGFLSLIFLGYSFFADTSDDTVQVRASTVDFSDTNTLYVAEKETREYVWHEVTKTGATRSSASDDTKRRFYYQKLSPIDGIYFHSESRNPISVHKDGNHVTITVAEGVYVFVLNDIFNTYEIRSDSVRIAPLGAGTFLFNNTPDMPANVGAGRIFSLSSLLGISLMDHDAVVAHFTLFPSSLFSFDPRFSSDLKGADLIRIATVNSVRYVDMEGTAMLSAVFLKARELQERLFLNIVHEDIVQKSRQYTEKYKKFLATQVDTSTTRTKS